MRSVPDAQSRRQGHSGVSTGCRMPERRTDRRRRACRSSAPRRVGPRPSSSLPCCPSGRARRPHRGAAVRPHRTRGRHDRQGECPFAGRRRIGVQVSGRADVRPAEPEPQDEVAIEPLAGLEPDPAIAVARFLLDGVEARADLLIRRRRRAAPSRCPAAPDSGSPAGAPAG